MNKVQRLDLMFLLVKTLLLVQVQELPMPLVEGTGINTASITEILKQAGGEKFKELLAAHESFKVIGIKDSGHISILGSGTDVSEEVYVLNSFILPNKSIKDDVKYEIVM
ncbi:unnamed protein product [Ambrosiozyma monospora]|uniref:Unnamed protein product n=1 Tax=Ambrosiozyma monospora TaxID=43982 RepID=A0A9W6WMA1_AMBMO|nr:unnamed protein product [Ambrosiozyma monospora]